MGVAAVPITPTAFEGWTDLDGDGEHEAGEPWHDTGTDRLWSYQEAGALGLDGRPGIAGVDDDRDGAIDDVGEYLAPGSDDVRDPAGDDWSFSNPAGTEGDGVWQRIQLAGFGSFLQGSRRYASGGVDEEVEQNR